MANTFFISDTHFGHIKMIEGKDDFGNPIRPWLNTDEMDEALIKNWNDVVRDGDKVYHLGDVTMHKKYLELLTRLNGKKCLIKGNHDIFSNKEYSKYFYDIRGCHVIEGIIMSHIPIHPFAMERFGVNVHGHLHVNRIMNEGIEDPRYMCVSVEQINFAPIEFGSLKQKILDSGGDFNLKQKIRACVAD